MKHEEPLNITARRGTVKHEEPLNITTRPGTMDQSFRGLLNSSMMETGRIEPSVISIIKPAKTPAHDAKRKRISVFTGIKPNKKLNAEDLTSSLVIN